MTSPSVTVCSVVALADQHWTMCPAAAAVQSPSASFAYMGQVGTFVDHVIVGGGVGRWGVR